MSKRKKTDTLEIYNKLNSDDTKNDLKPENDNFNNIYNNNNSVLGKTLHIYICITDLPIFKNFYNKIGNKIEFKRLEEFENLTYLPNYKKLVAKYIFLRLLRFIFFLDFVHDFCNPGRNNILFKQGIQKNKDVKKILLENYNKTYEADVVDIKSHIFKVGDIINKIDDYIKFTNLDNIEYFKDLQNVITKPENAIKQFTINILSYFDINNVIDINPLSYNCFSSLETILKDGIDKDINFYVDTDKSKYDLYPIIMRMCDMIFDTKTSKKFIMNTSILDKYDSASPSALQSVFYAFRERYKKYFPTSNKIDKLSIKYNNYEDVKIIIKLDKDDTYSSRYIDLTYKLNKTKFDEMNGKTGLKINRFFTMESFDKNIFNYDSSVSNISNLLKQKIDERDPYSMVLNS